MVHSQVSDTLWKFSRTAAIQNALSILIDYDSEFTEADRKIFSMNHCLKHGRFPDMLITSGIYCLTQDCLQINEMEPISIKVISESIQNLKMIISIIGKIVKNDETEKSITVMIATGW